MNIIGICKTKRHIYRCTYIINLKRRFPINLRMNLWDNLMELKTNKRYNSYK